MTNKRVPWKGRTMTILLPDDVHEWLERKASEWYCTRAQAQRMVLIEAMRWDEKANANVPQGVREE